MLRLSFLAFGLLLKLTQGCNQEATFASGDGAVAETSKPGNVPTRAADASGRRLHEESFPPARIDAVVTTFDPVRQTFDQALTLTEGPPAATSVTQLMRTLRQDTFRQGHDGQASMPESFLVSDAGKLDLLVVVDNSTSMTDEQGRLADGLGSLLSRIGGTDWQIAVVTTSSPCLRHNRLIKKGDADREAAFRNAVIVPLDNTVVEKGFPMAVRALRGECNNVTTPWLRAGSAVAVLILSDEDNCGSHAGEGCPGEQGETAAQMTNFLATIRAPGEARIYGLFEGPGNPCGTAALEATKYKAGVDATGGTWGSICAADYSPTLQAISDNVNRIVRRTFRLMHTPDAGTLRLAIDGANVPGGFTIAGDTVTFSTIAANATTLSATYAYGATPKFDRVVLTQPSGAASVAVAVNGSALAPASFTFDPQAGDVFFHAMPPDDAEVVVSYRTGAGLAQSFALTGIDMLGAPLEVAVNGAATADYAYDQSSGILTLGAAPADGAEVMVKHRTVAGLVTRYAAAHPHAQHVWAKDAATNEAVVVSLEGSDLVFSAADAALGRAVLVGFDVGYDPGAMTLPLAGEPVLASVQVEASGAGACAPPAIEGTSVRLACDGEIDRVELSYTTIAERFARFTVGGDFDPAAAEWSVLVNGEPFAGYTRAGRVVEVPMGVLSEADTLTVRAVY